MLKITFMGAGSTVFAKNVLGDTMLAPALCECEIALYDIDQNRLEESYLVLDKINNKYNILLITISIISSSSPQEKD